MKEKRHERAESFRQMIAFPHQRDIVIKEFLAKDTFDGSDRQRIMLLFQKAAYTVGCETSYRLLIEKIKMQDDDALKEKALAFSKKLK